MGVETAIIASALIGATATTVAANKQKQAQERAAEEQKKLAEEQFKKTEEANAKMKAEEDLLKKKATDTNNTRARRQAMKAMADSSQGKAGTILAGSLTGGQNADTTSKTLLGQ